MYHKLICVRLNDIHLLFLHFYDFMYYLLLIVLNFLYVFIIFLHVYIRVYARTYIKEHSRYLKCCLRGANKF